MKASITITFDLRPMSEDDIDKDREPSREEAIKLTRAITRKLVDESTGWIAVKQPEGRFKVADVEDRVVRS